MPYLFALCTVFFVCIGQVLLKKSSALLPCLPTPFHLFTQPIFLGAISLYGLTTLGWVCALQHLPLSRAYMIMSLSYVFIPFLAAYFFQEPLSLRLLIGAALIISGVIVSMKT